MAPNVNYQPHRNNSKNASGSNPTENAENPAAAAGMNGVAAPQNYEMYANGNEDGQAPQPPQQQQPQVQQQPAQVPVYSNMNNPSPYPVAPSPNAGVYSTGQYMVDANTQNIIGEFLKLLHFA